MEGQDMDSNNQEDIERMLARAGSLEKSILPLVDKGCIFTEKFCSDMVSWLKGAGLFEEEDIKTNAVREKAIKRNTQKPRTLWNNTDIEIDRICDSVNAAIFFGDSVVDKFKSMDNWIEKIESVLLEGQSEISNLKKKHSEEIEELTKVLERKKHEITLLKGKKTSEQSADERKSE